jgi:hypothetical protein
VLPEVFVRGDRSRQWGGADWLGAERWLVQIQSPRRTKTAATGAVFSCFSYTFSTSGNLKQLGEILKPEQWQRLIQRLVEIPNPKVPAKPSAASLPAKGKQPSGD